MFPKHKKSLYFFVQGLFNNLFSFSELENRISNLPEVERGDALEVFAEAYFNTQSIHQAQEVWPEKLLSQSLRDKLGILTDAGVDGVFKTHTGSYKAYQVKFRTNRTALTWDNDGLGKFFGQTDRVSERVLFTNSIDLSHITNTRIDFYSVKGNDLDTLGQLDFQIIENWLQTGVVIREKKVPFSHQVEAINNIVDEFKVNDRTTAIMACGTGKTLVALSVAEKINSQTTIVLLPSLALIRQTLHDWAKDHNWESFNFLCVCSDETVVKGDDETILQRHDIDFTVTTKKEIVEEFLLNKNIRPKIIFSTYQSCQIVAQGMPQDSSFDLAIFDEAHKTASRHGANYAFALQNKNLSIKKRLFLTATPRHYNINKKDKEGEQKLVFSMDDQETYGRISYQLSFRAAVEQNLICDYKVVVSIVTSEMINRELLKHGEVIVAGDLIKAQRVANILAIHSAIEKYGVKRIFSFHSSVVAAKSFTAKTNEGIGAYLDGFVTMHVNGEMSTSKRDSLLKEFKEAEKAIISNARCLTEGVNIPTVDMVAFISPKKSKVDIVQAAGRAMRKHDGKERGYISLPLFVQMADGETLEQAIEKTKFDTVWDVLQAMQEQDESLVEVIAQLREDRGKALGINDNRLRDHIEILGPELSLNELRKSITTKIIDTMGTNWDERFGELLKFKEKYGHCNVPQKYPATPDLGVWVSIQRCAYKSKKIYHSRIVKLESIGFDWNQFVGDWERMFIRLCEYYEKNGDCLVPRDYLEDKVLATWVAGQRKTYNIGKLSSKRVAKLNAIGFLWDPLDKVWNTKFDELCAYKEKHGDTVPSKHSDNHNLSVWAQHQRIYYREGRLIADRIVKLELIGFDWDPLNNTWDLRFAELTKYKEVYGNFDVPPKYQKSPLLLTWLRNQRTYYKQNKLSHKRLTLLESIGFIWDPLEQQWERMFRELCKYREENNHSNVPKRYQKNPELGRWCQQNRNYYKNGKVSEKRIKKLEQIDFIWDPMTEQWEQMFIELCKYREIYGDCNVPKRYKINKTLVLWVLVQRRTYKKKIMPVGRIIKLESIGFDWDPIATVWETKFSELFKYREIYGHCNVSSRLKEYVGLWRWTHNQRSSYKNGELTSDRINRLNEIGFAWKMRS